MQPSKFSEPHGVNRKWREEIWVMYTKINSKSQKLNHKQIPNFNSKKRIISAWRYPGMSPKGREIPIPDDIREELEDFTF
jgi:hypothetical protein